MIMVLNYIFFLFKYENETCAKFEKNDKSVKILKYLSLNNKNWIQIPSQKAVLHQRWVVYVEYYFTDQSYCAVCCAASVNLRPPQREHLQLLHLHSLLSHPLYGRNQSGCEKAKNVGFLPFILWVFLTIYI